MLCITIGISAQRINKKNPRKFPLVLGGTLFDVPFTMDEWYEKNPCDGDAILHALTRAVQQLDPKDRDIMGEISANMIKNGITDSSEFLKLAVKHVEETGGKIINASIMIEGEEPRFKPYIDEMRQKIAELLGVSINQVTILATTSDGMDAYGRGEGIKATAIVTGEKRLY